MRPSLKSVLARVDRLQATIVDDGADWDRIIAILQRPRQAEPASPRKTLAELPAEGPYPDHDLRETLRRRLIRLAEQEQAETGAAV